MGKKTLALTSALATVFVISACNTSYTTFSAKGAVEPEADLRSGSYAFDRKKLGGPVYSLPVTQLIIEGGPCVTASTPSTQKKTSAATTTTVSGGAQVTITNTPSATATATTAADKNKAASSGSKCDKTSDSAPYGIKVTATTVAQPGTQMQIGFNLPNWSNDKPVLKVDKQGLLSTANVTSESQVVQAVQDIVELAGMLSGARLDSSAEDPAINEDGINLANYKPGAFKAICYIDSEEFCEDIKVPLVPKTLLTTQTLVSSDEWQAGDVSLKSVEPCESDLGICTMTTTRSTVKAGDKTFLQVIQNVVVKAPPAPEGVAFAISIDGLEGKDCPNDIDLTYADRGLLFRAPTTGTLRVKSTATSGKPNKAIPITYINPCKTYVATPVRRGFVTTENKFVFDKGVLTSLEGDFEGPGGAVVGLPGDLISAFFSGLQGLLTLRIETINSETGLINAETAQLQAQDAYDQQVSGSASAESTDDDS